MSPSASAPECLWYPSIYRIVMLPLAKDPKQRYASTRDLARDLAAVRDRLADAPARESEPRRNNLPVQAPHSLVASTKRLVSVSS